MSSSAAAPQEPNLSPSRVDDSILETSHQNDTAAAAASDNDNHENETPIVTNNGADDANHYNNNNNGHNGARDFTTPTKASSQQQQHHLTSTDTPPTPIPHESHHKIDQSQKISNLEHIQSQILQMQDSMMKMKRKKQLDRKYKFDKLIYDPVTHELCRASEVYKRKQTVKKRFQPKIQKPKQLNTTTRGRPSTAAAAATPSPSTRHLEELKRHKRRFSYYKQVVKEINQEEQFKREFQRKLREERRQHHREVLRLKRKVELEEMAIKAMKERIHEEKTSAMEESLAERQEQQQKQRKEWRRKSLARTQSNGRLVSNNLSTTALHLEKQKKEQQKEEYKKRRHEVLSKINYPTIKVARRNYQRSSATPTDFQIETQEKQKEKREPHPNRKTLDYLGEMRRLRRRAAKRKKILKKRRLARERKRKREAPLIRMPSGQSVTDQSIGSEPEQIVEHKEEEVVVVPTSKKRQYILKEIYTTEKDYVTHLKNVFERYADPIQEQNLLPQNVYDTLFGSLKVIRDVHVNMMEELELFNEENYLEPVEPGGPPREKGLSLGNIFLEIAPAFKQYTEFINDYEVMYDIVANQTKKHKKFQKYRQQVTEQRVAENDRMTDLTDYLILPIQRIPRYRMLLADLVKNTSEEHPDHTSLQEALQLIIDIADYCNAMKKEKQNRERMEQLVKQLRLKDFTHPKRRFIREGQVKSPKPGSSAKKIKECNLYLFSDVIVVKFKKSPQRIYLYDGAATDFKVEVVEDASEPTFQLVTGVSNGDETPSNSFTFICVSNYELNEWVNHFDLTHSLMDPDAENGSGLNTNADTDAITATTSDLISTNIDA